MRRRRVWLLVGVPAVLCAVVAVGWYGSRHEPIRAGMTEREVGNLLGPSYDFLADDGPPGPGEGPSRFYIEADSFGGVHYWSVEFDRSGRVRSFSVAHHPFAVRPSWLEWLWPSRSPSRPSPFGHVRD